MAIGSGAGEVPTRLTAAWGLAELDLLAGDPGAAYARCESALDEALATEERALLVPYVVSGVRAALGARRADLAEGWLVRLRQALDGWETVARPAIDHADGLLRMSAGFLVQGRIALEAAEAGWRARGRTWEASWARLDIAGCLLRANREAEALALLEPALFDARALGSRPLEARAAELLEIARRRGAEEEPWRPLTAREFEVARLVADGLTNGAIGEQLGLSPRTVGAHVEHILAKLGVTRRAEIAAWVAAMAVTAGGVAG
jgi:DNA-binding CsgD family transcriptional regulator